jgi:hypothetical protein
MRGETIVKSAKPAEDSAMSDAISIARDRVELLAQPIGWHETKESRCRRVARKVGTSARRIRALLGGEKVCLRADEYLAIERAWEKANGSMASLERMAGEANLLARGGFGADRIGVDGERERPAEEARRGPAGKFPIRE